MVGEPHGEGSQHKAACWTHRFAEVLRQVGPLWVVEDAVVSAFGATGLRYHVHHAILTGHLDRGWSQSRQGLAQGPAQLWMSRPLTAQLGPSAQVDIAQEGRAKPPQGDLRADCGCARASPCGSNG